MTTQFSELVSLTRKFEEGVYSPLEYRAKLVQLLANLELDNIQGTMYDLGQAILTE